MTLKYRALGKQIYGRNYSDNATTDTTQPHVWDIRFNYTWVCIICTA